MANTLPTTGDVVVPAILGIGTAVPAYGVGYEAASQLAKRLSCEDDQQRRVVDVLYRRTRIENRGSVLLDEDLERGGVNDFYERAKRYMREAVPLATRASRAALSGAGMHAEAITHLVTVSCTGFAAPGVDIALMDALGLPATTERVHVGFMGCHGAINGLRVAEALIHRDPKHVVLLTSVELCSLHYQYGFDPDRIVSGSLFADGSAAVVLRSNPSDGENDREGFDILSFETFHPASVAENDDAAIAATAFPRIVATGSCLVPDSREAMTWHIGDHGYEMTLSAEVPELIRGHLRKFLTDFLARHDESIDSIGGWAVHPGGPRILSASESTLGLADTALATSRAVLREHGNMSSATMLFILERFLAGDQPRPWLMLGFGPGLEIEVALIR